MSLKRETADAKLEESPELKRRRQTVNYSPSCERFILHEKNYVQQYNLLYLTRLKEMRPRLQHRVIEEWGKDLPLLDKIIDIEVDHEDTEVALIGTLYKDMPQRGSVLDEFKDNNAISGTVQPLHQYCSEEDSLVMEDESGRIALGGAVKERVGRLVTGVVLAVKGVIDAQGTLQVNDILTSYSVETLKEEATCNQGTANCSENSKFIMLVSGLRIGNPVGQNGIADTTATGATELSAHLLMDFIAGRLHEHADVAIASKIVKVIVAGDSVAPIESQLAKERQSSLKSQRLAEAPSKQLDLLLGQLLSCCDVDIMPGASDPTNLSLPQQPLHPCLFPHSCRFNSFSRVSNPYEADFDGRTVMGHSGQPVDDIMRQRMDAPDETNQENTEEQLENSSNSGQNSSQSEKHNSGATELHGVSTVKRSVAEAEKCLDVLQDTLCWGHLCPTCPDTLPCYPFTKDEPFIVHEKKLPDVLFTGNQPSFASRLLQVHRGRADKKPTRLVSIPSFSVTGTAVLVDITSASFDCFTISFR